MQYLGGKTRIAGDIADTMLTLTLDRTLYVEPFLGAGSVALKMAPMFERTILSDAHPDLILMWQAVLDGWVPPTELSEEQYRELKNETTPSALRGFAGFPCSFGGKWFGGYARDPKFGRNFADVACRSLLKKAEILQPLWDSGRLVIECTPYNDTYLPPAGAVVYCDPPYSGTTGYGGLPAFDGDEFWQYMYYMEGHGCHVFVSEYTAPTGWESVWRGVTKSSLAGKGSDREVTENLYRRESN